MKLLYCSSVRENRDFIACKTSVIYVIRCIPDTTCDHGIACVTCGKKSLRRNMKRPTSIAAFAASIGTSVPSTEVQPIIRKALATLDSYPSNV